MKTAVLMFAFSIAACAPVQTTLPAESSPAGVHFAAERVSSGTVRLLLDNGAPHAIGYNLCTSALERRDPAGWTRIPTDEMCTMQLLTLNPGHDATFEKRLPAGLSEGEYRYVTRIESPLGTAPVPIATEGFRLP